MMASVVVSTIIDRPVSVVWDDVKDLASHVEWMADADAIRFTTENRSGVGTGFECETRIGPLRTIDVMEITDWVDERCIGVHHRGLITGTGAFTLSPVGSEQTEFRWQETLTFPWWLGGPFASRIAAPILAVIWRRNLSRLRRRLHAL
jgi:hypothetical protein